MTVVYISQVQMFECEYKSFSTILSYYLMQFRSIAVGFNSTQIIHSIINRQVENAFTYFSCVTIWPVIASGGLKRSMLPRPVMQCIGGPHVYYCIFQALVFAVIYSDCA